MPTTRESPPQPSRPRESWSETRGLSPKPNGLAMRLHRATVSVMRHLPRPLVRLAADAYIAGETRDEALALTDQLWTQQGLSSTCDVLGEAVDTGPQAQEYYNEFEALITELAQRREYANASIKLSGLGQEFDAEGCFQRTRALLEIARDCGQFLRIDMEDHTTTEQTLGIYRRLRDAGLDNCGVVLQSRLFRTEKDIEALASYRPNVRLCIGIYREPPAVALQNKSEMKRQLLVLLERLWKNQQHVGLATHEEWVIYESLELAKRLGKPPEELEVQMLLGVPRSRIQRELLDMGVRVRLYIPYGEQWHAYSMRRLENNPDMMRMVAANVLTKPFRRD